MRPDVSYRTCLAALASLALLGGAARADERLVPVDPWADLTPAVESACAAPGSPACAQALDYLTARARAALLVLAERNDPQAAALARLAGDSADPGLRAAAAAALATPFVAAEDTPLLAELADDPVPAVRAAALRSLAGSQDPRAQLLSRRAGAFDDPGTPEASDTPDAAVAAARVGVPLPADAVYLHFASAPGTGRYSYWTAQPPANVIATLKAKAKKGPLTPEQFRAQAEAATASPELEEGEMPSADDMARAMAMAEQMMKAMEGGAQGGSPEEQAAAAQRAVGGMASFDDRLAGSYEDAELFGDARLFVVPVAGSSDAVVAVYRDLAVGGTGVTVHRAALDAP
jgi:hypothetical protein